MNLESIRKRFRTGSGRDEKVVANWVLVNTVIMNDNDEWAGEEKNFEKEVQTTKITIVDILLSLLVPVVGIVMGIVQIAKKRYRKGGFILTISISAPAAYTLLFFIYYIAER